MDLSHAPSFISAKMAALSDARARAHVRADELVREIASLRDRFNGRTQRADDSRTDFPKLLNEARGEQETVSARLASLTQICDACRAWLAQLPSNATLEQVTPEIETGIILPSLRARIQQLENDLKALRQIPLPAVDIKDKINGYIRSLTTPTVSGVSAGEKLSVQWPGPPSQFAAPPAVDVFTALAFIAPEKLAERLLATIQKSAPPADRDTRVKDLEQEIERLQYAEETLVIASGADRIRDRPPQTILGCRVSNTRSARAA